MLNIFTPPSLFLSLQIYLNLLWEQFCYFALNMQCMFSCKQMSLYIKSLKEKVLSFPFLPADRDKSITRNDVGITALEGGQDQNIISTYSNQSLPKHLNDEPTSGD